MCPANLSPYSVLSPGHPTTKVAMVMPYKLIILLLHCLVLDLVYVAVQTVEGSMICFMCGSILNFSGHYMDIVVTPNVRLMAITA